MLNINLFGGPGTGKSTTAGGLFHQMKKDGYKVEYIQEHAKDLVFSEDKYKLMDQVWILANQHHPQFKLEHQLDYLIHDGPFLLGTVYLQDSAHIPEKELRALIYTMFNSYNNLNVFLKRTDFHEYQEYGRQQSLSEAEELDRKILGLLKDAGCNYIEIDVSENTVAEIYDILLQLEV